MKCELKQLYKDAAQIRMAGGMQGFQQLAAGKAMMGAGEGMAKGGGDGGGGNPCLGGAGLGVGMGMASMFEQNANQEPDQRPAAAAAQAPAGGVGQVTCRKVRRKTAPGKFCAECGQALAEKKAFCSECGKPMDPGTKFCGECGGKQPRLVQRHRRVGGRLRNDAAAASADARHVTRSPPTSCSSSRTRACAGSRSCAKRARTIGAACTSRLARTPTTRSCRSRAGANVNAMGAERSATTKALPAAAKVYDDECDEGLVFPHTSEVWRELPELAYLPTGRRLTDAVGATGDRGRQADGGLRGGVEAPIAAGAGAGEVSRRAARLLRELWLGADGVVLDGGVAGGAARGADNEQALRASSVRRAPRSCWRRGGRACSPRRRRSTSSRSPR